MANNKVVLADGTVLMDTSEVTVDAEHILSGYTALDHTGALITGIYEASAGSSNTVIGTFQFDSSKKGSAQTITLNYTGNGDPIAAIIFPSVGTYNPGTDVYTKIQSSGCLYYLMTKDVLSGDNAKPLYAGVGGKDYASVYRKIKNSSSDATSYSYTHYPSQFVYGPAAASSGSTTIVKFNSRTSMSVYVADDSYGFMDGIEYTYLILYSESTGPDVQRNYVVAGGFNPRRATGGVLNENIGTSQYEGKYAIIAASNMDPNVRTVDRNGGTNEGKFRFVPIMIPSGATKIKIESNVYRNGQLVSFKTRFAWTDSTKSDSGYVGAKCLGGTAGASNWDQADYVSSVTVDIPDYEGLDSFAVGLYMSDYSIVYNADHSSEISVTFLSADD